MAFFLLYSLVFLLVLLPYPCTAQSHTNISLSSSLNAINDGTYWSSQSGDFAFGFQQIKNDGYLLAIWFNKVAEKTIVWTANRNTLAAEGSKLELTADGRLVLTDPKGTEMWSVTIASNQMAYAAMLDTGNFVLATRDAANLWESFKYPTDTLLPTQTLNQGSQLVARYTQMNYSEGRFKFILQTDGNLVLYTTHFPLDTSNYAYWSTQTSIGSGFQVLFNRTGDMYLIARNGSILNNVFLPVQASMQDYYQRATIDYDGVLRHYVYPKNNDSSPARQMDWTVFSFIPENICLSVRGETESGACGFNSYCNLDNDKKPTCKCPPGYTFFDQNDERKGCRMDFASQTCDESPQERDDFEFHELINTYWPTSDYGFFESVSEDWCKEACLSDCYCAVVKYQSQSCWKKKLPLSNGRVNPTVEGKAFIKVRKYNRTIIDSVPKKKDRTAVIRTGSILLGGSVVVNILLLIAFILIFCSYQRRTRKYLSYETTTIEMNSRSFSYSELEQATGGFKEILGSGAYGTVYKGVLGLDNGRPIAIAVKKLNKLVEQGEQEFIAEVSTIGRTNHKNLVQLIGYCNEGQHRLLVYEFMSNGSLANFLFNDIKPSWYQRINVAFGVARGLLYLHEECTRRTIHCDIKPQNILLDDSLTAKISDFGLAKLLKKDQSLTTTGIRGTKGYVAPEWFKSKPITAKVDVYSFGIVLLELICCRKNVEQDIENEEEMILCDWAYECYKQRKLSMLVENDKEAMDDFERVEKLLMIAISCTMEDPLQRPTMKKVTQMLEGDVDVCAIFPSDTTSSDSSTMSSP